MDSGNKNKEELLKICIAKIEENIASLESLLQSVKDSRDNETKSSAGDKYETGRAMMQMEEEKNRAQLVRAHSELNQLLKINPAKLSNKVHFGSLVSTDQGQYFIAVGLGKVFLGDQVYYCISMNSPIGKLIMHLQKGDNFQFNGRTTEIRSVC